MSDFFFSRSTKINPIPTPIPSPQTIFFSLELQMGSSRLLTTVELRQLSCKDLTKTTTNIYLSTSITNATTTERFHHHRTQFVTCRSRSVEFTEEIRFHLSHTHQEITNNSFYLEIDLCSATIFSKEKVIGKVIVPISNLIQTPSQGILSYQITSVKKKKQRGILTFFFKVTKDSPQRVDPIPQPSPITSPTSLSLPAPDTKPARVTSGFYPSVDFSHEQLYAPILPLKPVLDPYRVPPLVIIPPDANHGYYSPQVLPSHSPPLPADYGFCGTPMYQPPPSPAYYYGSSTPTSHYYGDNCYCLHHRY